MPEPRLLVVTQPTRLEELRHRFNTDAQALESHQALSEKDTDVVGQA